MNRRTSLIVVVAALAFLSLSESEQSQKQVTASPSIETRDSVPTAPLSRIGATDDSYFPPEVKDSTTPVVVASSEVCTTSSNCGTSNRVYSSGTTVRRGLFGRRIVYSNQGYSGNYNRGYSRSARVSSGRWYLGKNLGFRRR